MRLKAALGVVAVATLASPAAAQDGGGMRIATVGAGVQDSPRYPGARARRIALLPFFDLSRPGAPMRLKAPDQGIGFALGAGRSGIEFGPALRFQYSRRAGRDVPLGMPRVGFTTEVGGFVQAMVGPKLRLRAEARQGIGGHKGAVLDLSADAVLRDSADRTLFSIGPRLRLSDGRYERAYFGVTPAAAAATGLPAFAPDAGPHAVGVWSGLTQRLAGPWGLYAYAGYDRMIGDAGRSPLVRRYGRRDELSGGLAVTYRFGIRLPRL